MSRRVLIVCSSFPPVNVTAVHRTLAVCRRLSRRGYALTVLTMRPGPGLPTDSALLRRVPPNVRVIRTPVWDPMVAMRRFRWKRAGAGSESNVEPSVSAPTDRGSAAVAVQTRLNGMRRWPDWLSWWLQVPDRRSGWLVPAVWAGLRKLRWPRADVIYSSAPRWTAHWVAMALCRAFRLPWVADCRDPWRANPFRHFPYRAHDRADSWLERKMVSRATFVICNTEPVRADFAARYSREAAKFVTICNGYDAELVGHLRRASAPADRGICRFIHTGSFYGSRSPVPFLQSLAAIVSRRPDLRGKLRFEQVGATTYDGVPLTRLAQRFGVEDLVEVTSSIPHDRALRRVLLADVAVTAGQVGVGAHLQIPRKFYEYYGLGKPILVTGGTCRAIQGLTAGSVPCDLWLVESVADGSEALAGVMEEIVDRWEKGQLASIREPELDFTEDRMAAEIESVLCEAISRGLQARGGPDRRR